MEYHTEISIELRMEINQEEYRNENNSQNVLSSADHLFLRQAHREGQIADASTCSKMEHVQSGLASPAKR